MHTLEYECKQMRNVQRASDRSGIVLDVDNLSSAGKLSLGY